eukprot:Skav235123  [mRNA]  locus=scaffold3581:244657:246681:- [translate_table: standard]
MCPTCRQTHGEHRGSMPDGSMAWSWSRATLEGQPAEGTIVLHFNFPSGTSQGQVYDGRSQHAYLPDNDEGRKLLAMFQLAFRRRLLFNLDQSLTTGRWHPTFAVHLKTSMTGGPARHGYPDDDYFASATRELRDKGIELQAALPVAIELRRRSSWCIQFFRRSGRFCSLCRLNLLVQWQTFINITLPFWSLLELALSADGRMTCLATLSMAVALGLSLRWSFVPWLCLLLGASMSVIMKPSLWLAIVTLIVMFAAVIFAQLHRMAPAHPGLNRVKRDSVRIFQRAEARLLLMILCLALARRLDRMIVFDSLALLLVLGGQIYGVLRRCVRGSTVRPLLNDMQQVLLQPAWAANADRRGPPLGPIHEEDWAAYASTPSLQGRTDMRQVHEAFLASLDTSIRNRASSIIHEMLANELCYSEAYVPLYHLYAISALLYEVQTVLAVELLGYDIEGPPVIRLCRRDFAGEMSLQNLLSIRERSFHDRTDEYRSLAVSAFSSCFASGGYFQSMHQFSLRGFPSGSWNYVERRMKDLMSAAGMRDPAVSELISRIKAVGDEFGPADGQVLQIFLHRSVVDAFAYGAQPLGALAPRGIPLTAWLQQQCPLEGQVRLVPHPDLFLGGGRAGGARVKIFDFCPARDINKLALRRALQAVLRPHLDVERARELLGVAEFASEVV